MNDDEFVRLVHGQGSHRQGSEPYQAAMSFTVKLLPMSDSAPIEPPVRSRVRSVDEAMVTACPGDAGTVRHRGPTRLAGT